MISLVRNWVGVPVLAAGAAAVALVAIGSTTGQHDSIGDLIKRADAGPQTAQAEKPAAGAPAARQVIPAADAKDAAEASAEQAQRLMRAVDAVLQDTARNRGEARKLPADGDFIIKPIWTETREDRERRIRDLLDAALGIITDVPIVELQKKIEALRKNIRELDDRTVRLREKQLTAPKDGVLPGFVTDTVDSLAKDIDDTRKRIEFNRADIAKTKGEVHEALKKSGIQLSPEQVDLLLDSVLSGDLVRLVAVFNSAKLIDAQLGKLLTASGESIGAARKYFAMHAALFAILVHAQDTIIAKIDNQYLPKLTEIEADIRRARAKTAELMKLENREDQKRALEGNRDSQRLAEDAARGYRRYLLQQREQVARARQRTTHDLRIADNTFETVEASFQLRNLMRDASASFEAIQKLEAPTFDQIFKNEELRREFESITRKLDAPTS
jgi:polyhydroxyalkanoate synthesis regulator phasin